MNPTFKIHRNSPNSPTFYRRMEVAALDMLIAAVTTMQSPRMEGRARRLWLAFDRQPAGRQAAMLAGFALLFFIVGFIKGAL